MLVEAPFTHQTVSARQTGHSAWAIIKVISCASLIGMVGQVVVVVVVVLVVLELDAAPPASR